jgi:hypothetical protein
VNVVGGGNGNPGPKVAIPGVYTGYEPGIMIVSPRCICNSWEAELIYSFQNIYNQPANYSKSSYMHSYVTTSLTIPPPSTQLATLLVSSSISFRYNAY